MLTSLGKLGFEVDLLTYSYGSDIAIDGVRIIRGARLPFVRDVPIGPSWTKVGLDVLLALTTARLVATRKYALIHGIEEGGFLAALFAKLRRIPFIYDMDSCVIEQLASSGFICPGLFLRMLERFEHWVMRQAKAILTVCEDLTIKAKTLVPSAVVHQIEDFPTDSATVVDLDLAMQLKEEFKLTPGTTLLYSGNFETYQGLDLLLDSLAILQRSTTTSFTLVLVGGSPAAIANYQRKAETLGIAKSVRFAGFRPEVQMGTFFSLADVLVSPRTLGGNTPLKLYSYMAAGKPIVATRISSHTQVLSDASAYLAAPTPEDFSQALLSALDSSSKGAELRHSRANACLELIRTRYNAQEFHRRMTALYDYSLGIKTAAPSNNSVPLRAAVS